MVKSSFAVSSVTGFLTVTSTVSVIVSLSFEVIVIIAVPGFLGITLPFSSTSAISGSLDLYVSSLFVASSLTEAPIFLGSSFV